MKRFGYINENGVFTEAPNCIIYNGFMCFNPKPEHYIANGYYEVITADVPEELMGKARKQIYVQKENYISREWVEDIVTQNSTIYKKAIIEKVRAVYSIDDEIAILRQKDTKPEEFETYYNFVEQCKAKTKAELGL